MADKIEYIESQLKKMGYWDIEYQNTENGPYQTRHFFIAQTDDYMHVYVYEKDDKYVVDDCYADEESYVTQGEFERE
jgi:hypothetical protein